MKSAASVGKVKDLTGPGITDRFGAACTDLGASVRAPDGHLVSVFGDTFSGHRVGVGDWRSPVILIGSGDATHPIVYHRAAGTKARYAQQLWRYKHTHSPGLLRSFRYILRFFSCCKSGTSSETKLKASNR